jgi:environmental stress-induced protein Ves
METTILNNQQFKISDWSGGTTTELYIFPADASYQERNFVFRLSTARVEIEKSEFTSLPGVTRKIMILDGEIRINHQNHYAKTLRKFDVDTFEGDWKTTSVGRCTDFNLMTTEKIKVDLTAVVIEENQHLDYPVEAAWNWVFIYLYSGQINIHLDHDFFTLNSGILLVISNVVSSVLQIKGVKRSELVFSKIKR